jgi:hypothetical protein
MSLIGDLEEAARYIHLMDGMLPGMEVDKNNGSLVMCGDYLLFRANSVLLGGKYHPSSEVARDVAAVRAELGPLSLLLQRAAEALRERS